MGFESLKESIVCTSTMNLEIEWDTLNPNPFTVFKTMRRLTTMILIIRRETETESQSIEDGRWYFDTVRLYKLTFIPF